jgi:hypothetical protein
MLHAKPMTKTRSYKFYDTAVSLCSHCLRRVDAKIVFQEGGVWMHKRCPQHGFEKVLIADDIGFYRRSREVYLKVPEQVQQCNTPVRWGCPYDCGICPDHEQHGCILIIELTDNCNLRCPTCYARSGPERESHRSLEHIERMLDRAVANEETPAVVQLSGGEPTMHPQFFEIVAAAQARPIGHLMINTNGIRIASEAGFAQRLREACPDVEVYLQFDSFRNEVLQQLRGADLVRIRRQALENLNAAGVSTTLVSTIRRGLNDDELGKTIDFALTQPCVRGVNFQPVQAAGRLDGYEGEYDRERDRLTLTEVRRRILEQSDLFAPEDIVPVPCHADSVAMAYALKLNGKVLPLTHLIDQNVLIDQARNTIAYENDSVVREKMFDLFSTRHSPQSQADSVGAFLGAASSSAADLQIDYRNIFRVLIVQFIDAHAFDLRSIRKSCVHIVHPDAQRVIPFDTYNMFYRDGLEQTVLNPLRREREAYLYGAGSELPEEIA